MGSQFEVECCSPFLPLELRVERCSRDRTLGSFDTFIHEGMKTEYLSSRCFHVFHVRAVSLSLFFFSSGIAICDSERTGMDLLVRGWRKCGKMGENLF